MAPAPSFSRVGDFRGDQRARGGQAGAGIGGHGRERLLGGGDIAGEHRLLGAQQLVVIVIGGLLLRQFGIQLRRVRVPAGVHQLQGALLLVLRSLRRVDQAARGRHRAISRGPHRAAMDVERSLPYPSCSYLYVQARIISDKSSTRAALRGGDPDRQSGRPERACLRDLADLRIDRGGGHAPHRGASQALRHRDAAAFPA